MGNAKSANVLLPDCWFAEAVSGSPAPDSSAVNFGFQDSGNNLTSYLLI